MPFPCKYDQKHATTDTYAILKKKEKTKMSIRIKPYIHVPKANLKRCVLRLKRSKLSTRQI